MYESSVVQHFFQQGIEQGIEQGARESIIAGILEALEVRFNSGVGRTLQPTLESIEELQRLKDLRREAFQAQSLEAFAQTLSANGNGTESAKNGDAKETPYERQHQCDVPVCRAIPFPSGRYPRDADSEPQQY